MTQAVCRGQGSSGAEPHTLPHLSLASSTVSRGRELTHEASFHPTTRSYNQLIFIEHLQMPGPVLDSAGGGAAGGAAGGGVLRDKDRKQTNQPRNARDDFGC